MYAFSCVYFVRNVHWDISQLPPPHTHTHFSFRKITKNYPLIPEMPQSENIKREENAHKLFLAVIKKCTH